ncbi:MAG: hypothetical protein WD016_08280 [Balneolaceae bacterium]
MKKYFALYIILLFFAPLAVAQVEDSLATDTDNDTLAVEPLPIDLPDIVEEEEEPEVVFPWIESQQMGSSLITNDSLLRWQVWPHWGEYQAYRRDVISFRQGTSGRVDAFHINGYQPYEQQVRMEGITLNNPVTGLVNYNLVPHRKISTATETFDGMYRSEINLRDYYITQPISYLNYDESEYAYRNLEFMVARNFTASTNLELSYWDRRDGDFYPNNDVEGSQVVGRLYHHLNENYLIRAFYLRNQFNIQEPFGYSVSDPRVFAFDRFTSQPFSSNGNSEFTRWDLVSGIYHRRDSSSAEDAGFEAIITKNKNELTFIQDTLSWDITSLGTRLFKNLEWKAFKIELGIEGKQHLINDESVLDYSKWSTWSAKLNAGYNFGSSSIIYGKGILNGRSDSKNGFEIGGGLKMNIADRIQFNSSAFLFSRIPEMQVLYWQSENYAGNSSLENEDGISISGGADFRVGQALTFGISARYKDAAGTAFLSTDSTFTNSEQYSQVSGTIYGRFESSLFEIESSATAQQFDYEDINSPTAALNNQDQIVWLRNSAFVKGYVFDRAAFVKFGFKTLLSPAFYASRTYNTELGFWQGNSVYEENPAFFRLDTELSARVRAIMVVIRWENSLDGIGQAGYFEAAGFPMPPRRLIVGIRAQFRN